MRKFDIAKYNKGLQETGPIYDGMMLGIITADNITPDQIETIQRNLKRQPRFAMRGFNTYKFIGWDFPKEGIDWALGTNDHGTFGVWMFKFMLPQELDKVVYHMWMDGIRHDFTNREELSKAARAGKLVKS